MPSTGPSICRGPARCHIAADPVYVELPVGQAALVSVTITNTSSLIDAYDIRAFGLDPKWVSVTPQRLSLFPEETGVVEATITLPPKFPAGPTLVAIHVQSENDPTDFSLAQVSLDIGKRPSTTLRVDPTLVIGGNTAQFGLIVVNEGNATIDVCASGIDPEDKAEITFDPPSVVLAPGHREVVQANVKGGRPWFGQPKPRVLTFALAGQQVASMATFLQRPRIGRWLISLLGLITVASIFAAVLSRTFDHVVEESEVQRRAAQPGPGSADRRGSRRSGEPGIGGRHGGLVHHPHRCCRRAGRAVHRRQRRRADRQRGDRQQRRLRVQPAGEGHVPDPLHRCRLRRAVVRRGSNVRRRHGCPGRRRQGSRAPRRWSSVGVRDRWRARWSLPTRRAPWRR